MAKRKPAAFGVKLTDTEEDLISQMRQDYQVETDLLGGDLILRRLKDDDASDLQLRTDPRLLHLQTDFQSAVNFLQRPIH